MATKLKRCCKCNTEKTRGSFYKRSDTGKLRADCKACINKASCLYVKKNRARATETSRKYQLKKLYGLSWEDFIAMSESQNKRCAICKEEKKLSVDHCHKTGQIRGLLCNSCNAMLGFFNDDIPTIERAIAYLESQ